MAGAELENTLDCSGLRRSRHSRRAATTRRPPVDICGLAILLDDIFGRTGLELRSLRAASLDAFNPNGVRKFFRPVMAKCLTGLCPPERSYAMILS